MGFIIHFYIIFGTNLLTQGPVQIAVFFAYFSVSQKRNIKWNPNRMKPSGAWLWNKHGPKDLERSSNQRGGHEAGGAPSPLVGPSWLNRPTSSSYIYSYTLKTSRSTTKPYSHCRNLMYPRDPILGPFSELRRRGIDHGGPLHQLHGPSDDVWVVYFRPSGP